MVIWRKGIDSFLTVIDYQVLTLQITFAQLQMGFSLTP